jgi:hypothetical protein
MPEELMREFRIKKQEFRDFSDSPLWLVKRLVGAGFNYLEEITQVEGKNDIIFYQKIQKAS